jgi:DNA end-binding protein Ku
MRAKDSGTITFGLVSIPVKIYSANSAEHIQFNQLAPKSKARVKQQLIDPTTNEVVPYSDTLKGYEYAKGQFITFSAEELENFEAISDKTIDLKEFVPATSVDYTLIEKLHYLGPDKGADKAYSLLAATLTRTGKVAVGQWNARSKQHLVTIRAIEGKLVLQQMFYAEELRDLNEIDVAKLAVSEVEINMAEQLVSNLSSPTYDHSKYRDEYKDKVLAAIDNKVAGKQVVISPVAGTTTTVDLFEALKKSLEANKKPPVQAKAKTPVKSPKKAKGSHPHP